MLPSDELTDEPSDFGSLRPGTRLGRYELLVPIARGGMARVWAARQHGQRGFQKLVAIKTILPHLAEEPEFERMFLDEARIASGVHHPNVCEIYELGEDQRTLYLAMEWVNGDSLSRVLRASGKTEAFDARVVARIVADACAGVHAAHELTDDDGQQLGVVHRDMSPHNVLITADGVTKVCDFGVAKALGQLHEQTSAGQLKGKISYMSPEQVTGASIDRRSDVFSLGCVLYEATTGVRPFKGDRDHIIMHAILSGNVEPPSNVIRSYPPELERIVLRALAHQPILRYPTAERMRFALEEFLTKGQLVTQSNVAQVIRSRLGGQLERRKERIKQASSVAEQGGWEQSNTGSSRDARDHRSGVKPSRPLASTMPLPQSSGAMPSAPPPAPRITVPPSGAVRPGKPSMPPAIEMPSNLLENASTGQGLGASPQINAAGPPFAGAPSGLGAPPHTLPIGPGGIMSPFHTSGDQGPSGHSSPGHSSPGHSSPGHSSPGHSSPGHSSPGHSSPGHSSPGHSSPGHSSPGHSSPGHSSPPGHSSRGHSSPSYSNPGYSNPGYSSPGHSSRPGRAPGDWSSPGHVPVPIQPPHTTLPPGAGIASASGNPYGPTAIYDVAGSLPPEVVPDGQQPTQAGAGQYALAAVIGVLIAVLIGGGGFFIWQTRTTQDPLSPPAAKSATATPEVSAVPAAPASPAAPPEIALRTTPAEATVVVDGSELPPDMRSVLRPAAGQTTTVVVRAEGYEDRSVLVDSLTPTPLDVKLEPVLDIDVPDTADPASAPAPAASSAKPVSKPRPKDPNVLPDNPY